MYTNIHIHLNGRKIKSVYLILKGYFEFGAKIWHSWQQAGLYKKSWLLWKGNVSATCGEIFARTRPTSFLLHTFKRWIKTLDSAAHYNSSLFCSILLCGILYCVTTVGLKSREYTKISVSLYQQEGSHQKHYLRQAFLIETDGLMQELRWDIHFPVPYSCAPRRVYSVGLRKTLLYNETRLDISGITYCFNGAVPG